jgi:hypothetical protein
MLQRLFITLFEGKIAVMHEAKSFVMQKRLGKNFLRDPIYTKSMFLWIRCCSFRFFAGFCRGIFFMPKRFVGYIYQLFMLEDYLLRSLRRAISHLTKLS